MKNALLALVLMGSAANAATVSGSFTLPTKYVDGTDLPVTSIKHVHVEVGTCVGTAFGVVEAQADFAPPATNWSILVLGRSWGEFCARAQTVTVLDSKSDFTNVAKVVKSEPKPNPPTFGVIQVAAFEVLSHPIEGTRLGRNVGTVPIGTACGADSVVTTMAGEFHEVAANQVTLTKAPKSAVIVARCEMRG